MAYTNGIDITRVLAAMQGRIGWRGTTPSSGRYFEDFHALVTSENINAVMPQGAVLSTFKTDTEKAAILRCLNAVFTGNQFVDQTLIYNRYPGTTQTIDGSGQFTGYCIDIDVSGRHAVQIDSAVLNFTEDVTFTLYLFADGKKTAVKTQEVAAVAGEATVVDLTDFILTALGKEVKARTFYIGYFQDDLGTSKAVQEQGCRNKTRAFNAMPFYSQASGTDFDRVNIAYPSYSYGLNLEVSSFIDYTELAVKRANLFDEAVGLQFAYMVLEQIIYAVRSNATERIIKNEIDMVGLKLDLDGYAPVSDMSKVEGLAQRIRKELERVNKQFFPKPKAQTVSLC